MKQKGKGGKWLYRLLKLTGGISLATLIHCIACASLEADIYLFVDEKGCHHFTNEPPSKEYRLFVKEESSRRTLQAAGNFDSYIEEASREHHIDVSLLKAIIKAESNFNPLAVSKKGAKGLMQIMPENFTALQLEDPFDPKQNIMAGSRYLKNLLVRFKGNIRHAIAAYNAGPYNVERHQGIPPIKETIDYVRKVMQYYSLYKN